MFLQIKNFKEYVLLMVKGIVDQKGDQVHLTFRKVGDWEVGCTLSSAGFQQFSLVNSVFTFKGGRHVENVANSISQKIKQVFFSNIS